MSKSEQIAQRIQSKGEGWVFTPSDFLDVGTPHLVGMALLRMAKKGNIRRLDRGLYDFPKTHAKLGTLHPRPEGILEAIARRDGTEFQEHESYAANRLRLTEQVPARLIYLTSGRSRTIKAGLLTIELRHRTPRKLTSPSGMSAMVFSALRNIGKANLTHERIHHLRGLLTAEDRCQLLEDLTKAPVWMHPHLRSIAGEEATK